MLLYTPQQLMEWDAFTVKEQQISFTELMELAGAACTEWIVSHISADKHFTIVCGKGNNGGDGLVIARLLAEQDRRTAVYIIENGKAGTEAFGHNLQALQHITRNIHFVTDEHSFPKFSDDDVIIDCIFGTGLNRKPEGITAAVINHINNSKAYTVSADIPSGMFVDQSSIQHTRIRADVTLSFQAYKLCFLLAENATHIGQIVLLDIGLSENYHSKTETVFQTIDKQLIHSIYKKRNAFAHKGHFGHALLIAGSDGKTGAAILSAKSCLRSGVGLLTCCVPASSFSTLNSALPEAMTIDAEDLHDLSPFTIIGIGPGLGRSAHAKNLLNIVFENSIRAVADADALNLISEDQKLLALLPPGSVITPHPKEFDRLFGESRDGFERIQKALDHTRDHDIVVVLKDHHTLIAYKGKGYFNMTGNAGLAKGGSGDVLTGIITALAARQYDGFQAAILGVYLHGSAADLALGYQSKESLLASDVADCLGRAFSAL